jgi:hypothetical protein
VQSRRVIERWLQAERNAPGVQTVATPAGAAA